MYTGSFDPITFGHVNIIKRAAKIVDELLVLVCFSASKQYLFSPEERVALIQESIATLGLKNVKVSFYEGLVVDYAMKHNISLLVRGMRAVSDFEHESAMSRINNELYSEIETIGLFSDPGVSHISSRFVKEIAKNNGSLQGLVPEPVQIKIKEKL